MTPAEREEYLHLSSAFRKLADDEMVNFNEGRAIKKYETRIRRSAKPTNGEAVHAKEDWLNRYRREKVRILRIDRAEREGRLVDAEEMKHRMSTFLDLLRTAGERLQQQFGESAHDLLNDAIDEAVAEVEKL